MQGFRLYLAVAASMVAAIHRPALGEPPAKAAPTPNIVVILSDDQGYGDYGFMGHDVVRTPRLDEVLAGIRKMADGRFFQLSYHLGRASYAKDRSKRQLLTPGQRQQIDFRSERLVSRKLQPGSRLVIVLQVIKQPDQQINYGTGRDVGDETIADAGKPLEIRWYGNSYVDIPVWQKVR